MSGVLESVTLKMLLEWCPESRIVSILPFRTRNGVQTGIERFKERLARFGVTTVALRLYAGFGR